MEPSASIDDLLAAIHAVTQPGPENATLTDDQYAAKKKRQSLVKKWEHIAVIKSWIAVIDDEICDHKNIRSTISS